MANILVFTEISDDHIKRVTLEIIGRLNGHNVDVALVGELPATAKEELAKYGAVNIHCLKGDNLDKYSPEGYSNVLKSFINGKSYDYVFSGSTALGKDLMPRVAASLDAAMASEITDFKMDGDLFKGIRPLFAGKCLANVEITGTKPHFVTVRPNALGLTDSPNAKTANVTDESIDAGNIRAAIKEIIKGVSDKVDLTEASIIVSGGRAMKDQSNFKILDELANVLGASVGASRAAVDSGYASHDMQVGQTGKTVSPNLYIACGISGAIQHMAGMRTSKVIVAINTDPDAPIFNVADYGIVGDLFKVVPVLTEELKKML